MTPPKHTVTYQGPKDRRDGTTVFTVPAGGAVTQPVTLRLGEPQPVAQAVVDRLASDDLAGHKFDVTPTASTQPPSGD